MKLSFENLGDLDVQNVGTSMPREDTQFKGYGVGIPHDVKPIAVKFPPEADTVLRGMSDRSAYIREAVLKKLREDGLLLD